MSVDQPEHELVAERVDTRPWGPTEADEQTVLEQLYGPPDDDGIYRGEP
jgi:hypothetical protein